MGRGFALKICNGLRDMLQLKKRTLDNIVMPGPFWKEAIFVEKKRKIACYARTLLERGDLSGKEKKDREGSRRNNIF